MLDIRQVSVDDFFDDPETDRLLQLYAAECAIDDMPRPVPHVMSYKALEASGALHAFAAYVDGKMVGFIAVIIPILPHYSVKTAATESFFVDPEHRSGGLGLKIIAYIERYAKEQGAAGLLISAPAGSRLEKMMSRFDYKHTNTVFFRAFK